MLAGVHATREHFRLIISLNGLVRTELEVEAEDMVFSSYGNSSSFYLPLDSDQSVPFYKNENSLFSPQPPSSVVCRRNQDNATSTMSPNEQPFGNNSHGTVVVDAVCHDFQPVAHLSSNGYYGYVPPTPPPKMMSAVAVNAGTVSAVQLDCQTEDAAMDCGEMENFHQLQHQQHQRKRKEYVEEATTATKRRKTWLEEEQQAAGKPPPPRFAWYRVDLKRALHSGIDYTRNSGLEAPSREVVVLARDAKAV